MISKDLQQSLTDLQVAVLEKLARRQGNTADQQELVRLVEKGGIAYADGEIRRPTPQLQPSVKTEVRTQVPLPSPLSFFRRLSQRWFGRG